MFKAKCKCIECEHLQDGIYYQRNELEKTIKRNTKSNSGNAWNEESAADQ